MASKTYAWRDGYRTQANAQSCGERLERIKRRTGGQLGAADLVEDATHDRGSPLRACFEWTDSLAAGQWRLHQARNVLGALVIVKVGTERIMRPARAYYAIGPSKTVAEPVDRPYVGVEDVKSNPHYRARILANLLTAIERLEHDYDDLLRFLEHDFVELKTRISEQLGEVHPH